MSDAVLEVLDPGLLSTIQDLGRPDQGRLGVSPGGAADRWSHRVANLLVGNAPAAATIELTLVGGTYRVLRATTIGVAGADLRGRVEETGEPLPPGAAVPVRPGWKLTFPGPPRAGARAYLAVPGGIAVPLVLGSASTALGAAFGGHGGRPLNVGDRLRQGPGEALRPRSAWPGAPHPEGVGGGSRAWLRVRPGPHAGRVGGPALDALVSSAWTVAADSDRVGLRLDGPALPGDPTGDLVSHGVTRGTIQVPPDRRPILLGADHQPTGGYPVLAVVIVADRAAAGQLAPGASVRFAAVDDAEARSALGRQREAFRAAAARLVEDARWDELAGSAGG